MTEEIFVCPKQKIWHAIYEQLLRQWHQKRAMLDWHIKPDTIGPPPPKTLIITNSGDFQCQTRWNETIDWAKKSNCQHLIPELKAEEMYCTPYMRDSPFLYYARFNYDKLPPKVRPSAERINKHLLNLKTKWKHIVDDEFGTYTYPLRFTGSKYRRLIVAYQKDHFQPWFSWVDRGQISPKFTAFRSKINSLIAPHEVDHIDFRQRIKA